MITKFKIFEKTTLISIGVPYDVMQKIQRNYALSDDAKWDIINNKNAIKKELNTNRNNLIISVCEKYIYVIYSFDNEQFVEKYSLIENDDFGNIRWERISRSKKNIKDILDIIDESCKLYKLIEGEWSKDFSTKRKIRKENEKFDDVTNNFKKDFAKNFTRIVKRLYGKKAKKVSKTIIEYLSNVNDDIPENKIKDILFSNVDNAKRVEYYKKRSKEKDPYKLYSDRVKEDSLSIFNEYLILFENDYSDKYKEFLNIPEMINRWSREKIMTAFMIYLYNGILIDL